MQDKLRELKDKLAIHLNKEMEARAKTAKWATEKIYEIRKLYAEGGGRRIDIKDPKEAERDRKIYLEGKIDTYEDIRQRASKEYNELQSFLELTK